jgi:hypothetical protein
VPILAIGQHARLAKILGPTTRKSGMLNSDFGRSLVNRIGWIPNVPMSELKGCLVSTGSAVCWAVLNIRHGLLPQCIFCFVW